MAEQERRKASRISTNLVIQCQIPDGKKYVFDVCQTKNISTYGVLLNSGIFIKEGTIINLSIRVLGSNAPCNLKGKIIECKERGKGYMYETRIEFVDLNQEQINNLSHTLEEFRKYTEKKT